MTDEPQRQVKEAIYIKMAPPGMRINRDEGLNLSLLWLSAVQKLCSGREGNPQMLRLGHMLKPNPPSTPLPSHRRPTPNIRTRRTARTSHAEQDRIPTGRVDATHWTGPRPLELHYLRSCTLCLFTCPEDDRSTAIETCRQFCIMNRM